VITEKEVHLRCTSVSLLKYHTYYSQVVKFVEATLVTAVDHGILELKTAIANLSTQINEIPQHQVVKISLKSWMVYRSDTCDLSYEIKAIAAIR